MSGWLLFLAGWVAVGAVVAPLVGRRLRRTAAAADGKTWTSSTPGRKAS